MNSASVSDGLNGALRQPGPVIVISTVHGAGHGAEAVLENLLQVWNSRLPLIVAAPADARVGEVAAASNIRFVPLATPRDALRHNFVALRTLQKAVPHAALVHAWHPRGFELAWLLARHYRCSAIGTLHDHARAYYFGRLRRWLIRVTANRFRLVVAVSQATAEIGRQCGLRGPFQVILNGITDQPQAPEPRPKCIGFLGMNAPGKGFSVVRGWIEATADSGWEWHLYGDIDPTLQETANALVQRYPNQVFLRGQVKAASIYREIGVLVHASTAFETFGMVVVEAGRAGIPVVASNIGGLREVAADGETAFLFTPSEPAKGLERLRQLLKDEALRAKMGQAGRRRFERLFRAERMADDYAACWRELID